MNLNKRLNKQDALDLFESDDIFQIGELASTLCNTLNGDNVFYVRNHHINPTNVCVNRCKFCAFSRSKGQDGAYEFSIEEIIEKLRNKQGIKEVHIVGGLHPDWPVGYYLNLIKTIKKNFPALGIKAFTAVEIDYMSRISGMDIETILKTLKDCGLDTMPGGGAEIFDSNIRSRLCAEKIDAQKWLEVHEIAHNIGIKTNATMLYGHIEDYKDRVDHLFRLRDLQDKTGGFQAFIPLSYHPKNTETGGTIPSGIDDLKTIAISRLVLDNFRHIKAYWIMLGDKLSQTALLFGADDIEGTVMEEKITHSAGGTTTGSFTVEHLRHLIKAAGKVPVERDSFYNIIG
ncbi:MAG: aminofutalosine synthase MqnE [Nitrospirae bacterium]|nr:aminofutalosine synthase MqnE [Nitrospirota bacterium]MBF0539852.1 aminofutalosine synthase MqnE [Nitrospirota bacterium]